MGVMFMFNVDGVDDSLMEERREEKRRRKKKEGKKVGKGPSYIVFILLCQWHMNFIFQLKIHVFWSVRWKPTIGDILFRT